MTYQLILGNRLYFSWSIAAYLMVEKFGLSEHFDIQIVLRTVHNIVRPEGVDGIDFTTEFMGTWGDSPEAEQQEACSTEVGSPEILITGGKEL